MYNALTIDVEDYYMVSAFSDVVKFEDWTRFESRVEQSTNLLLDCFDEYDVRATFFVLGWVAEHVPHLIKAIHRRGHEVACHGYNHRLVYDLSPQDFCEDTRKAKHILEDITGEAVKGYRAASYSITNRSLWALDILIKEGFAYDSSVFPIHHDRYGVPESERFSYLIRRKEGELLEIPPSTLRIFGKNIPLAGGGYLRLFPSQFTERGLRFINEKERHPAVVYVHPWEVDMNQPKINGSMLSLFRHHVNINKTQYKLRRLLGGFRFAPMRDVFADKLS